VQVNAFLLKLFRIKSKGRLIIEIGFDLLNNGRSFSRLPSQAHVSFFRMTKHSGRDRGRDGDAQTIFPEYEI
jgi:hypothetical protein